MLTPDDILARLRETLAGRSEVWVAVLFGSRARGTAREDSDVDLAVVGPEIDLLGLGAELGTVLGLEVDVVSLDSDSPIPLLDRIVREGIVVHEARPGAGAIWRSHTLATLETDRPWHERLSQAWLRRVAEDGLSGG